MNNSVSERNAKQKVTIIGLFCQFLLFMLYLCYFGAFINEYLTLVYSSIPLFIIRRFEFYRFITSLFITDSFLEVVYVTFSILTIINFWENKEGSFKIAFKFLYNAIIFQLILVTLNTVLSYIIYSLYASKIKILPGIILSFLVKHLLKTNTKYINIYKGKNINDRLITFVCILGFVITCGFKSIYEITFSLIYGFIMCKYEKLYNGEILLNEEKIMKIEKNKNIKFVYGIDSYISQEKSFIGKRRNDYRVREIINTIKQTPGPQILEILDKDDIGSSNNEIQL